LSGCLKIDAVSGNKIYLRNCGKGVITNNSLSVFIDDVKVGHSLTEIGEDQTGTVNISGLWKFSMDRHNLKLTNGAAFVQALIELEPNKDGLVGYWSFDEGSGNKVYDKSGNGNGGTISGAIWTAGRFGKAIYLRQGTSDKIDITGGSGQIDLGNDWSIETWFLYPIEGTADWRTLTRGSGGDHQIIVQSGSWNLGTYDNTGGTGFHDCGWDINVLSNGWHHLAAVQTGGTTGKIEFYIDGKKVCEVLNYGSVTDVNYIGNCCPGNQQWGTIDDLRIYNRALTPDETVVMKRVL